MSDLGNKETMAENIKRYMKRNDISRSQLSDDLGISYTTISDWINAKTYPRIDKIEMMANYFGVHKSDLVEGEKNKRTPPSVPLIPIVGKVAAGEPNYAVEDIVGYMTLPPDQKSSDGLIYLEVSSDSMDKQFPVGSYVLVDTNIAVENGDIAVVKINGEEATLKQVKFDEEKKMIFLVPNSYNESHNPAVFNANEDEVRLVGKVIGMYQSI